MRYALLIATVVLGAAMPALAQNSMGSAQSLPAPNAAQSAPQPDNSLPTAPEMSTHDLPGSQLGQAGSPVP